MILGILFRFTWALFWSFFGAVTALANGFDGYAMGIGAFLGLTLGHLIRLAIDRIVKYSGLGK